jgi:hypothetical protein
MSTATKLPDVKRSLHRVDSNKSGKLKDNDQNGRPKSGMARDGPLDGDSLAVAYAELKDKHDQRKEAFDQVVRISNLFAFFGAEQFVGYSSAINTQLQNKSWPTKSSAEEKQNGNWTMQSERLIVFEPRLLAPKPGNATCN